jgi:hypothetical protein
VFWAYLFAALLLARLCHADILWADEDYHLASSLQLLHGKALYRDLWYDKPPLNVYLVLPFARTGLDGGWFLRLGGAFFALLVCWLAYRFASRLWPVWRGPGGSRTSREGQIAAVLMAMALIFYFPGATLTLEPDTLMLAPHLAAVYFAWRGKAFLSGLLAAAALLLNVKGVFVVAAALAFLLAGSVPISGPVAMGAIFLFVMGFTIPVSMVLSAMSSSGTLAEFIQQVWTWGRQYSAASNVGAMQAMVRVGNWIGFHAAMMAGSVLFFWQPIFTQDFIPDPDSGEPSLSPQSRLFRWVMAAWVALACIATALGGRFVPRYFDVLLPVLVIAGARGISVAINANGHEGKGNQTSRRVWCVTLLIAAALVPVIRFGPRYFQLAGETLRGVPHQWSDTAMDRESRQAARVINSLKKPGDTLFVWGYRPNVVVYTQLPVSGQLWDSQPITGVPADRHLHDAGAVAPGISAGPAFEQLIVAKPAFIADGLSLYNPQLALARYVPAAWLADYCETARVANMIVYRRCRP